MIIQLDSPAIILIVHPTLLQSFNEHCLFQNSIFSSWVEIKRFNLGVERMKEKSYMKYFNGYWKEWRE